MEFLIPYEKSYPHRKGIYKKALIVLIVFVLLIVIISLSKKSKADASTSKIPEVENKPGLFDDLKIGEVGNVKDAVDKLTGDKILLKISDKGGHGVRFLVIADCGGVATPPFYTEAQMKLARAMDAYSQRSGSSFILSLGDNFSPAGVTDLNDRRFVVSCFNTDCSRSLSSLLWRHARKYKVLAGTIATLTRKIPGFSLHERPRSQHAAHKVARVGRRPLFCHRSHVAGRGQAAAPGRRVQGHQVLLDQLPGPRQGGVHVLRGGRAGDEGRVRHFAGGRHSHRHPAPEKLKLKVHLVLWPE